MAFIPVPNAAKVAVVGSLDSQEIVNTLWFTSAGGFSPSEIETLAGAVSGWWIDSILPYLNNGYTMAYVTATDASVSGGAQFTDSAGAGETGGVGGSQMPNNLAFCVSFRTGFSGRSNRGRNYVSALSESNMATANRVDPTWAGQIKTGYEVLLGDGIGFTWVVASQYHDGDPRVSGVTNPVTSVLFVDTIADSQRRRLPGRGV